MLNSSLFSDKAKKDLGLAKHIAGACLFFAYLTILTIRDLTSNQSILIERFLDNKSKRSTKIVQRALTEEYGHK